ncbi:hypothetical protein MHYP_G00265110 [Metynnis hypsauchen]
MYQKQLQFSETAARWRQKPRKEPRGASRRVEFGVFRKFPFFKDYKTVKRRPQARETTDMNMDLPQSAEAELHFPRCTAQAQPSKHPPWQRRGAWAALSLPALRV